MNRVILLTLVAAAVALAGCGANDGTGGNGTSGGNTPNEQPPQDISESQAQTLLQSASGGMPETFGMRVTVTKAGAQLMTMNGAVDNATGRSYFEIKMDPSVLQGSEEQDESSAQMAATLANGFSFYATKTGIVYLINDTAFSFPATESGSNSFVPSPDESPFGEFLNPAEAFGGLGDNVTVKSVRPITYKGKAAYEIQASIKGEDDALSNATIVLYKDPARLARIEGDIPAGDDEDDQLAGGHAVMEMDYDDVKVDVPERVLRAAGLQYDGGGFSFGGGDEPKVWTFKANGSIPLSEVEVQVKDASAMQNGDGGFDSLSKAPTLWSMKLSDGTKTQDGVTLTFTDADHDNKVSAGDTLRIEGQDGNGAEPQVVLYDAKTGTYVVPGAGLVLSALALVGVALLLRRK